MYVSRRSSCVRVSTKTSHGWDAHLEARAAQAGDGCDALEALTGWCGRRRGSRGGLHGRRARDGTRDAAGAGDLAGGGGGERAAEDGDVAVRFVAIAGVCVAVVVAVKGGECEVEVDGGEGGAREG
ncbi:hypothetical protein C8J57DRAFT_1215121 [Mycena rebaudengoi]|nr:hypothetical protein C8J57DRAFT_1215121 [Mycena rebaudengoi]